VFQTAQASPPEGLPPLPPICFERYVARRIHNVIPAWIARPRGLSSGTPPQRVEGPATTRCGRALVPKPSSDAPPAASTANARQSAAATKKTILALGPDRRIGDPLVPYDARVKMRWAPEIEASRTWNPTAKQLICAGPESGAEGRSRSATGPFSTSLPSPGGRAGFEAIDRDFPFFFLKTLYLCSLFLSTQTAVENAVL